jgi:hypothetical protein
LLRLRYLGNQFQKRTIRPKYAQYQGYPYAANLDSSYLGSPEDANDPDLFEDVYTFPSNIYLYQNGLIPGLCMAQTNTGTVVVASGLDSAGNGQHIFGLLANFVGGNLDELAGGPYVGCWRGLDSTYVLLNPAFNPTGVQAAITSSTTGFPVSLYCGPDGRLCVASALPGGVVGNQLEVGYIVNFQAPSLLEVNLVI